MNSEDLQQIRGILREEIAASEQRMVQRMTEQIASSEQRMMQRMTEQIAASEQRMIQRLDRAVEAMTANLSESREDMNRRFEAIELH